MALEQPTGKSLAWDDYETQFVSISTNAANNDGTLAENAVEGQPRVEPAAGLDRDEVAELVAADYSISLGISQGADTQLNPSRARGVIEVSADPELNGGSPTSTSDSNPPTGDGDAGLGHSYNVVTDPDILFSGQVQAGGGYKDGTDGTGGGPSTGNLALHIPYRQTAGESGPVYDRHDNLYVHQGMQVENMANGKAKMQFNGVLFWDVQEDS